MSIIELIEKLSCFFRHGYGYVDYVLDTFMTPLLVCNSTILTFFISQFITTFELYQLRDQLSLERHISKTCVRFFHSIDWILRTVAYHQSLFIDICYTLPVNKCTWTEYYLIFFLIVAYLVLLLNYNPKFERRIHYIRFLTPSQRNGTVQHSFIKLWLLIFHS